MSPNIIVKQAPLSQIITFDLMKNYISLDTNNYKTL